MRRYVGQSVTYTSKGIKRRAYLRDTVWREDEEWELQKPSLKERMCESIWGRPRREKKKIGLGGKKAKGNYRSCWR
jgi:hypothetical protein